MTSLVETNGRLKISLGQRSNAGRKESNQDFYGACIPKDPLLTAKGIAVALADGIGSSDVSHIASRAAVTGFLEDYYCTSEAWSVRKSAQRVLEAINSWLYSQTRNSHDRYNSDRGYVCTFSAVIVKSATAHLFHVGDSRIYQVNGKTLEQLTDDHRLRVSQHESFLTRALGWNPQVEIDYRSLPAKKGTVFLLTTDGVHEHASPGVMADAIDRYRNNLDDAANAIVHEALRKGSKDNLTVQIVRVDEVPLHSPGELCRQVTELPFPPILQARTVFDGYQIVRELHASHRSHVYLAVDGDRSVPVVLKTPSIDHKGDPAYLERLLMEEWIARRINSPYVLKPCLQTRQRNYLYIVTEFVEGQTLTQWMIDNPNPDIESVRRIIEQIAKGLNAFHRMEMVHQDLRPDNVMIDSTGTVKIIDFGSTTVGGVDEIPTDAGRNQPLGTAQYTAPECFLGELGSARSDLFSLGVVAYQMLSGRLPYGTRVASATTRAAQRRLAYRSILNDHRDIPVWIDAVLRKAVHPDPNRRYQELSEFVHDLRHPNRKLLEAERPPLIERNPVAFWQGISFILLVVVLVLAMKNG